MSVAIVLKSPLEGGNFEVGRGKGTELVGSALCSGYATMSGASPGDDSELPDTLAKKQRLVLDKADRYLLDQGFGAS